MTNDPNQTEKEGLIDKRNIDDEINCEIRSDREKIMEEQEARRERSKKMRRKAIPILAGILAVMILLPTVLILILQGIQSDEYEEPDFGTHYFYKPYEGDILTYDVYLNLDRTVQYYDNYKGYGLMEYIDEKSTDPKLVFLYHYLQAVINGDAAHYRTLFSNAYYQTHEMQADFAQQMLYDMTVYLYSQESLGGGETRYTYALEYKIHKNNGTFRKDIGSDMSRHQFIVLHTYADDRVEIDDLVLKKYVYKK